MSRSTVLHDRSRRPHGRKAPRRWRPNVETLEERCTPTHPVHVPIMGYTLTDLGTFGGEASVAYAVNNHGQVVGVADYPFLAPLDGVRHAFLWDTGKLNDLGAFTYLQSVAHGLNDLGQAVGWAMDDPISSRAMLWDTSAGTAVDLEIPGRAYGINNHGEIVGEWYGGGGFLRKEDGLYRVPKVEGYETTAAYAINDAGQVVGAGLAWFDEISQTYTDSRAFLWTPGKEILDLGTLPGWGHSEARAVNSQGQVVGRSGAIVCGDVLCDWQYSRAFLWQRDVGMIDLGDMGFDHLVRAAAHDINEHGQVVGTINGMAFLYAGGSMLDLNMLLGGPSIWHLTAATGINEAGQIAGYGEVGGQTRAFLLTPQRVPKQQPLLGVVDASAALSEMEAGALTRVCIHFTTFVLPPPHGGPSLGPGHGPCPLVPARVDFAIAPADVQINLIVKRPTDPPVYSQPPWCGLGLELKPADVVLSS